MRIDVVSVFPDYLSPLQLSLLGKARTTGLIDLTTHDLRTWAHDRHHTTDDTPYGGGAGMVMKPEPWGEALDAITAAGAQALAGARPHIVVPTPSGAPFDQRTAERLARQPWLVFVCGRYEGIDQRVVDHYSEAATLEEISIGDYVLNGGEVAAMVVIEAVARLVPGFMGNPDSLSEESHGPGEDGGMLEYPVYTKPPSWRGREVPEVLFSGHHGEIARWRRDQARRRTAARRPDLMHPSQSVTLDDLGGSVTVGLARPGDAAELLVLTRACWVKEAQANDAPFIPPLVETLDDVLAGIGSWMTVVARAEGRLVASVRARLVADVWDIGRLMVAPDLEGRGLGRWLLEYVEAAAPEAATSYALFTGAGSEDNLRMYRKAGYRRVRSDPPEAPGEPVIVAMTKPR